MYYVMKQNPRYEHGWERITSVGNPAVAQRLAKALYDAQVWDQQKYDKWHHKSVAPRLVRGEQ